MRLPDRIALAGSLAVVAAAVAIGNIPALMPGVPLCPSVILFHRQCPGCGLTRSFAAIGRGALAEASALNPLGPVLFGVLLAVAATRACKQAWPRFRHWDAVDAGLVAFTALAVAARAVTFYFA
jgi:hypothetical protein